MLANLIDGADVGMIESRGGPRLAAKAFQGLGISGQFVGQEFQRDETPQFGVFSFVDHTHPAAAELFDNAVVRDGLADHSWRILRRRKGQVNGSKQVIDPAT